MTNSIYDLKHKATAAERALAMPDDEIVHAYPHIAEMIGPDLRYADIIGLLRAKHRATVDRYARTQTAISLMMSPTGSIGYLDGLLSGSDRLCVNSARQIVRIARQLKNDALEHQVFAYLRDRFDLAEETADDLCIATQLRLQGPDINWSDMDLCSVVSSGALASANDIQQHVEQN